MQTPLELVCECEERQCCDPLVESFDRGESVAVSTVYMGMTPCRTHPCQDVCNQKARAGSGYRKYITRVVSTS